MLEDDETVAERHNVHTSGMRDEIYVARRKEVEEIIAKSVIESNRGASLRTKVGRWMLRPITGIPMLAVTLYIMYKIIGVFVAGTVVGFTEETIMEGMYRPFIEGIAGNFVTQGTFFGDLLIGEFGILTMAPIYILGLLLPLIVGFYILMAVLEDSGYLPRIAALVDRSLTSLGLNGKAIIPLILGFGCVTMATMTTRILGTKREKIIATFLLGLAIPCSAQLGVIAGLISQLGAYYTIVYVLTILAVFIIAGTLLNKFMPGESSKLLIEECNNEDNTKNLDVSKRSNTTIFTWCFPNQYHAIYKHSNSDTKRCSTNYNGTFGSSKGNSNCIYNGNHQKRLWCRRLNLNFNDSGSNNGILDCYDLVCTMYCSNYGYI